MGTLDNGILYLIMIVGGVAIEGAASKIYYTTLGPRYKKHHFTLGRYLFLLLLPLVATLFMTQLIGLTVLKIFFGFAILGTTLEWLAGRTFQSVTGDRLWTYKILTFDGNTSLLVMPVWGLCGVLFWLLARTLGRF